MYTYEDFMQKAKEKNLLGEFSDADLKLAQQNPDVGMSLLSGKESWHSASTDDERALINAEANSLRRSYGDYDGGKTGSDYTLQTKSPSSYQQEEYKSPYEDRMNSLMDKVENTSFDWNADTDEDVATYKKAYAREGQRATDNALGQAASMTGGIPSSFAVTAGAQAGQYYAAQMADKIPELRQQKYNEFLQEKTLDMQILDALEQLDQTKRSQFDTDRSFDYSQLLDDLNFDATETANKQSQMATEKSELQTRADTLAKIGDFSLYEQAYGFTPEQVNKLSQVWQAAQTSSSNYTGNPTGNLTRNPNDNQTADADADFISDVRSLVSDGVSDEDVKSIINEALSAGTISKSGYAKAMSVATKKKSGAAAGGLNGLGLLRR